MVFREYNSDVLFTTISPYFYEHYQTSLLIFQIISLQPMKSYYTVKNNLTH